MSDAKSPAAPMKVFFILGGPGSGKGTNCERLVEDFGYAHFSTGELLRDAAKHGTSDVAKKIAAIIKAGDIVPSEITVELLAQSMKEKPNPNGYLIDGFPRKADQAKMFEDDIVPAKGIVYFDCSQETMESRLLARGAASVGDAKRPDDDIETIRHRFTVNKEQCMPVVEDYQKKGRCIVIDANRDRDVVYADVKKRFIDLGEVPRK